MRHWIPLVVSLSAVNGVALAAPVKIAVLPAQMDKSAQGMVPKLIDDYLLTAVQNASDAEVIGEEDVNTLLGFDKQKELLGCDDVSCMANLGGALGVDKVVAIKIARLESDWVVTMKLINIRDTRVEARSSDFVKGDVKALLTAVPGFAAKLFGKGGPSPAAAPAPAATTTATASPAAPPPTASKPAPPAFTPNPALGSGSRTAGAFLTALGGGAVIVGLLTAFNSGGLGDNFCSSGSTECMAGYGTLFIAPGLLLAGIGSGQVMNGRARAITGDEGASGKNGMRWLGWTLFGLSFITPIAVAGWQDDMTSGTSVATIGAVVGGSLLTFLWTMWSDGGYARMSNGATRPFASLILIRDRDATRPGLGLAATF
ncbi:MAG: hypothetical protein HY903_17190 [Deltaproteobacteria bacterium]|nr:hypothetical protein [Deltaproteobacteria bacterium]